MNHNTQWDIIKLSTSSLQSGDNIRIDCPFCGGKNTLSITRILNNYVWNCYRSSCSTKGRKDTELTLSDLRNINKVQNREYVFKLPESFISPIWHNEALDYMNRMHCLRAFEAGAVQIFYDPPRDRVVFITTDMAGTVVDANGRSLNKYAKPKWYRYGKANLPFVCNRGRDTLVLVEDAPSACAVFPDYTGMALQGTNVPLAAFKEIKEYKHVLVCLDPDAYKKSIEIRQKLAFIHNNVSAVFIPNDLKYFNQEEIKRILDDK